MEKDTYRTFQVLDEISKGEFLTQRDLAKKMGIALGLTNAYLKRLIKKGYVMVQTMPRNRLAYNLTPKGIAEKARLTFEYMKFSFEYYRNLRSRICNTFARLEKGGTKKIVFYGIGEVAEIAYISLNGVNLDLVELVDDNKVEEFFFGKKINSPEILPATDFDKIIITAFSSKDKIIERLKQREIPEEKIITF